MGKKNEKVTELVKVKPREKEEKFFAQFSETQLTAITLIILAATFLVQGIIKYLESINKIGSIRPWFMLILLSLILLVSSVVSITWGVIISPLKIKRRLNLISFGTFILGVILFLAALLFLLFVI